MEPSALARTAQASPSAASTLMRVLHRAKFYVLINTFVCGIALASYLLVSRFQSTADSSATNTVLSHLAVYGAGLTRIAVMVTWFDWIGSTKAKILGDKRTQLTFAQKRSIQLRILWLAVSTECLILWIVQRAAPAAGIGVSSQAVDLCSFLLEFAAFIPKSLVFEVVFGSFHFAAHWLCHRSKWLYQHAHKRHHMHLHPCPLSTHEQDVIDVFLTNVLPFVLAVYLGFPLTTFQLYLIFTYKTYLEVAGHCGLDAKGPSFPQSLWADVLSICLRVHDHDLHHTHPKFNFSKRFTLWDKVFGTFRPRCPLQEPPAKKL